MKRFFSALWRMLRGNLFYKIVSVVFALIIWSYVMAAENPIREITVEDVQVSYVGVEEMVAKNMTVDLDDLIQTVDVSIMAGQNDHKNINNNSVRASVDLTKVNTAGELELKVDITPGVSNATVRWVSTPNLTLHVDQLMEKEIPVSCVLEGTPADGIYVGDPVLSSDTVTIVGAKSDVERIVRGVCYVPVDGLDSSVRASYMLTLLDENNEQVVLNSYRGSVPSVVVELEVLKKKSVSINADNALQSVTNIKQGYEAVGIDLNPSQVEIAAEDEVLEQIDEVYLKPLNADGADRSVILYGEIQGIDNVVMVTENKIAAYVQIDEVQSSKTFQNVPIEILNLEEGRTASLSVRRSDVTVSGGQSAVDEVQSGDVKLYVDLADMNPGTYVVPVRAEAIAGITDSKVQITNSSVTVTIS